MIYRRSQTKRLARTRPAARYAGRVLRLLRDEGPLSRTGLSDVMGLSPTTITRNVADLMQRGWIEETDGSTAPPRVGRPAIGLRQRPEAVCVCGIQIGVGVARVGVADAWNRVLSAKVIRFDPAAEPYSVLDDVAAVARTVVESAPAPCLAAGVAVSGPVDVAHRVNLLAINLGWADVHVADRLEAALDLPVVVDHDVRSMALAEARYGGHAVDSLAYLYVRTGLGLGVVLKGEPFFGGTHGVSVLGHIRVRDDGDPCACGARGCLETVANEPFLGRTLSDLGVAVPSGTDAKVTELIEANRGMPGVARLRADLIDHLSRALAIVVNLMNPEVIVVGGALADAPAALLDDLASALRDEVFPLLRNDWRIVRPALAEAGIAGGAAIALEWMVYSDPE